MRSYQVQIYQFQAQNGGGVWGWGVAVSLTKNVLEPLATIASAFPIDIH